MEDTIMAQTAFETVDVAPGHLFGNMDIEVLDPSDPGTPTNIIETDDAFKIKVNWTLDGTVAPYIGGTWHVSAYIDDRDGVAHSSGLLGTNLVPVGAFAAPLPRKYTTTIFVPARRVEAGLYDLTVAITYDNGPRLSIAAFCEGPILEFYDKADG
jgi:hypothetical protein